MTLRFVVKSSRVSVAGKSPSRAKSAPARTEGHYEAFEKQGLAAARKIINTCGDGAESPPPDLRSTKAGRGPDDGASNLGPTLGRGSAEFAKYLRRGRRDAAWASFRPNAAASDFHIRKAPEDFPRMDHVHTPRGQIHPFGDGRSGYPGSRSSISSRAQRYRLQM